MQRSQFNLNFVLFFVQADEAIAIWRGFTKCRYIWCSFHNVCCFIVHVMAFCCTFVSFFYTRAAESLYGPRVKEVAFRVVFLLEGLLFFGLIWIVVPSLMWLYNKKTNLKWKSRVDKAVWAAYKIFIPSIALLCNLEGFDDLYSFLMLLSAALCVAAGIGVFFVTDDFGITACMVTVALTTIAKLPDNRVAQYIAAVIIGAIDDFIAPSIRSFTKSWFLRRHFWFLRSHMSWFGRRRVTSKEEEAAEYAKRRDHYLKVTPRKWLTWPTTMDTHERPALLA